VRTVPPVTRGRATSLAASLGAARVHIEIDALGCRERRVPHDRPFSVVVRRVAVRSLDVHGGGASTSLVELHASDMRRRVEVERHPHIARVARAAATSGAAQGGRAQPRATHFRQRLSARLADESMGGCSGENRRAQRWQAIAAMARGDGTCAVVRRCGDGGAAVTRRAGEEARSVHMPLARAVEGVCGCT
jgi:hypothetical protein